MKPHVSLKFFCDDASGEYGLAHDNSIQNDTPFNAFWGGIGIFHDVFEHWFEGKHKYFKDEYAFNVGGEMTAMGAAMYYYYILGIRERDFNSNHINFDQKAINSTMSLLKI